MLGSDTFPSLQLGQARRSMAGYFEDPLLHSVRRNTPRRLQWSKAIAAGIYAPVAGLVATPFKVTRIG